MSISSLERVTITTHKVSDYIPISSTIFSLIEIFLRYLIQPIFNPKNHHFAYINDKSPFRAIILLVPIIGNLIVLVWRLLHLCLKKKTKPVIIPSPIPKAIEVLSPVLTPKVLTDATNVLRNPTPMVEDKRSYLKRARDFTYGSSSHGIKVDFKKAIPLLEAALKKRCYDAAEILANLYLYGFGVQKNVRVALSLYNKAAHAGHLKSILTLALYYKIGTGGIKVDPYRSLLYYRRAAKKLSSCAMVSIGYQYEKGSTVLKKNEQKALKLYKKAWKLKNAEALYLMAEFYFHKKGGSKKKDEEVLELFRLAASHLQMQAVIRLYHFTLEGELGIVKDPKAANALMEPLMSKTYNDILMLVGCAERITEFREKMDLIIKGAQHPYSIPSAIKYLKLLVSQRQSNGIPFSREIIRTYDSQSSKELSLMVKQQRTAEPSLTKTTEIIVLKKQGKPMKEDRQSSLLHARKYLNALANKIPIDHTKAIPYLKIASKMKYHDATRELAHLHLSGLGTPIDIPEAFGLLYRSAHTGHLASMKDLALLFSQGLYGIDVDHSAALPYLRRAAKQGDGDSLLQLGKYLEEGVHVKKNEQKALKYYKAALKAGERSAYYYMADFYYNGKGGYEIDNGKILDLFKSGSQLGCPLASYMVYIIMAQGHLGLAADPMEAREFIEPVIKNTWAKLLEMKEEPEIAYTKYFSQVKFLLQKTSSAGLACSKRILAEIHEKGLFGYPVDKYESNRLLKESEQRMTLPAYLLQSPKNINPKKLFKSVSRKVANFIATVEKDDKGFESDEDI